MFASPRFAKRLLILLLLGSLGPVSPGLAAAAVDGGAAVVQADPDLPRPAGPHCEVQLFQGLRFTDFQVHPFSYLPPRCAGPWAKVLLEADFSVSAGRQYDRTASIWLGGVNLYVGTTQEPSATVAPHWHVARDLTDYASLFQAPQPGKAVLANLVNGTYTGLIQGSAKLVFYPAPNTAAAPHVPDAIYPLSDAPDGGMANLETPNAQLSRRFTLPGNIRHAYLDVLAQSQHADEFWYVCVPDALAQRLQSCGGGSFREVEVLIDGQLAGLAPVYPWIYTGGIDPALWRPTPGVQTLKLIPFRVDLSPFAGLLDQAGTHQIALQVEGANDYFAVTASLLIYRDPQAARLSGGLLENTLGQSPRPPQVRSTLPADPQPPFSAQVMTRAQRQFIVRGYLDTAEGRVFNEWRFHTDFSNRQDFLLTGTRYRQVVAQLTRTEQTSRSWLHGRLLRDYHEQLNYPLSMRLEQSSGADGAYAMHDRIQQGYLKNDSSRAPGRTPYRAALENRLDTETQVASTGGKAAAQSSRHSQQNYHYADNQGSVYEATTRTADGQTFAGPPIINELHENSHPDGSPDSAAWRGD